MEGKKSHWYNTEGLQWGEDDQDNPVGIMPPNAATDHQNIQGTQKEQ